MTRSPGVCIDPSSSAFSARLQALYRVDGSQRLKNHLERLPWLGIGSQLTFGNRPGTFGNRPGNDDPRLSPDAIEESRHLAMAVHFPEKSPLGQATPEATKAYPSLWFFRDAHGPKGVSIENIEALLGLARDYAILAEFRWIHLELIRLALHLSQWIKTRRCKMSDKIYYVKFETGRLTALSRRAGCGRGGYRSTHSDRERFLETRFRWQGTWRFWIKPFRPPVGHARGTGPRSPRVRPPRRDSYGGI